MFLRAFLNIKIPLGFSDITIFDKEFELFRQTLLEFTYSCVAEPPPSFAHTADAGSTLVLNMGPDSQRRASDAGLPNSTSHNISDFVTEDGVKRGEDFQVNRVTVDSVDYYQVTFNGRPDEKVNPNDPNGELRIPRLYPAASITKIVADAGDGNDTIEIGEDVHADLVLSGGLGNDTIIIGNSTNQSRTVTVHGGDDDDQITGSDGNETIFGDGGNDVIVGGRGADTLYGGVSIDDATSGNDRIFGGEGNDLIYGGGEVVTVTVQGTAPEVITTRSKDGDLISGGAGNDVIFGGAGDDKINGDAGSDWIFGDADDDTLVGESLGADPDLINFDNDVIFGGAGADDITGGIGLDWLVGEFGNDVFNWRIGDGIDPFYSGDGGSDTIFITADDVTETILLDRLTLTASGTLPTAPVLTALAETPGGSAATLPTLPTTVTRDTKGVSTTIAPSLSVIETATIENISIDAGAGADTVEVGDLKGSGVVYLEVDLGLSGGTITQRSAATDSDGNPLFWVNSQGRPFVGPDFNIAPLLTGTGASTDATGKVVTLSGSPDLSDVLVGISVIQLTTSSGVVQGVITNVDNGSKTVTVETNLGVSLSGLDWLIPDLSPLTDGNGQARFKTYGEQVTDAGGNTVYHLSGEPVVYLGQEFVLNTNDFPARYTQDTPRIAFGGERVYDNSGVPQGTDPLAAVYPNMLQGTSASISGSDVTLDGSPDLSHVATDESYLVYLTDPTNGERIVATITAKSGSTVTLGTIFNGTLTNSSNLTWGVGRICVGSTDNCFLTRSVTRSAISRARLCWITGRRSRM